LRTNIHDDAHHLTTFKHSQELVNLQQKVELLETTNCQLTEAQQFQREQYLKMLEGHDEMKRKVKLAKEQRNAYKDGKEQSEKRVEQLTKELLRLQVELEKAKVADHPPIATLDFKPSP
jgi:hypothetical protein